MANKRRASEQVKNDFFQKIKDEGWTINPNDYKKMAEVLPAICPKGHNRKIRPDHFMKDKCRCTICSGKVQTTEDLKEYIISNYNGIYELVGEYKGAKVDTKLHCNICGEDFDKTPDEIKHQKYLCVCQLQKHRDEKADKERISTETFKKELYEKYGDEYELLEDYIDSKTPVLIKHRKCGKDDYHYRSVIILKGCGCKYCADKENGLKQRKSSEQFKQEVFNRVGNEYTVLGEYETSKTPIKMRHNSCNCNYYEWDTTTPSSFLSGTRCPECFGTHKLQNEDFDKRIQELYPDEYERISDYTGSNKRILVRHLLCNSEPFPVRPTQLYKNNVCPNCRKSMMEKITEQYFKKLNIKYQTQYIFEDCKFKKCLPFDFAVFYPDGELAFLVEMQGIQHYEKMDYDSENEDIYTRIIRDKLKRKYCSQNYIPLLEFSYHFLERNKLEQELEDTFTPLLEYLV